MDNMFAIPMCSMRTALLCLITHQLAQPHPHEQLCHCGVGLLCADQQT